MTELVVKKKHKVLNLINRYTKSLEEEFLKNKLLQEELLEYKNKYELLKNNYRCIICLDTYVNVIPSCGHVGLCKDCVNNLPNKRICVICKENIKYIEIFLPYNIEKIDEFGEIVIENKIVTNYIENNIIKMKKQIENYKNSINLLESTNNCLLNEIYEIDNPKKVDNRKNLFSFTKNIDYKLYGINFFKKKIVNEKKIISEQLL